MQYINKVNRYSIDHHYKQISQRLMVNMSNSLAFITYIQYRQSNND